jgi:hypothetical protein
MRLSDVDLNSSHLVVAAASAIATWYLKEPLMQRKEAEMRKNADYMGQRLGEYVAQRLQGFPQKEMYAALEELTKAVKEVRDELRQYRRQ